MVYNTQDYCVFGLCPSSGILKKHSRKHFGNWMFPSSGVSNPSSEEENVSSFRNVVFYCFFLEYQTMDKVQKVSNSEDSERMIIQ
jgi:hypothetical protein